MADRMTGILRCRVSVSDKFKRDRDFGGDAMNQSIEVRQGMVGNVFAETEKNAEAARPLVSFVLIAYNQEAFVCEAVEAAMAQTYEPMELVLSDDCSTDRTFAVMEEMAASYKGPHRIVLNRNERNLGIGPHFERAVSVSNGQWIVAAAGDDVSVPERVSRSMEVVARHGELGGVFGRFHGFTGSFGGFDERAQDCDVSMEIIGKGDVGWIERSKRGRILGGMQGCTAMWNRRLFEEFSPMPSGVLAEDVVLGCRALISGLGVGFTSAEIVYYRGHGENLSSGQPKDRYERRVLFSRAVVHRDVLECRKRHCDLYPDATWERMIRYFERYLFRSIAIVRRIELGRIWSEVLLLVGLQKRRCE